ncbi:hypothetical protein AKJ09_08537 [Labilithrix luteola]|uniref:Secreted protein n=1 Tax=Labilithrix luteola TaxID=1391654 RepID=A0A0K1Q820_9BACT|nr:hypothetical protein [Labilithrix luteola]AKV01874.1 hypothetical protein AKJ09_08537 [Labilithrix luteola]
MTLSAKWTSLSILAIAALGAVACTVTSGTVDDSNGGKGSNTDVDSGSETADSGTDSTTGDAAASSCEDNKQSNALVSMECQACLEQNCCTELKGCFNIDPGTDDSGAPLVSCNDYAACLSTCSEQNPTDEAAYQKCVDDTCVATADAKIPTAFDNIIKCGGSKGCSTVCGIQTQ